MSGGSYNPATAGRGQQAESCQEIDLGFRKAVEGRGRQPEILGEQLLRGVSQPVADAEGAEFGEVAVVENEDEVARLVAQGLDDMTVPAREIPDIAWTEVIGLRAALWVDHRSAHQTFGDKGPLRRRRVPMKLPHHARLHAHRDAGDPLRYRQLGYGGFLAVAAAHHPSLGFLQLEFEGWKLAYPVVTHTPDM